MSSDDNKCLNFGNISTQLKNTNAITPRELLCILNEFKRSIIPDLTTIINNNFSSIIPAPPVPTPTPTPLISIGPLNFASGLQFTVGEAVSYVLSYTSEGTSAYVNLFPDARDSVISRYAATASTTATLRNLTVLIRNATATTDPNTVTVTVYVSRGINLPFEPTTLTVSSPVTAISPAVQSISLINNTNTVTVNQGDRYAVVVSAAIDSIRIGDPSPDDPTASPAGMSVGLLHIVSS